MPRENRRSEPAMPKAGYFRMTIGEHEAMKSAAKEAGLSFSAYVRQRLGLEVQNIPPRDQRRGPPNCTCGIAIAEARRLCTERDCPYR